MKLSIVIPVFNEQKTIQPILEKVLKAPLPPEITERECIVVDDFSSDGTREVLKGFESLPNMKVIYQKKNMGKGAALRTGLRQQTGDIIIIQDADPGYDPAKYIKLVRPFFDHNADVVYGSRFSGGESRRIRYNWHTIENKFITFLSNIFSGLNLTDMETGCKAFRSGILQKIVIEENRSGFETEITAKIAELVREKRIFIQEVGISYHGGTLYEGKKIRMKDAFRAFYCIFKYNTSRLANLSKYAVAGMLVALSQLVTMVVLVEGAGFKSILQQNLGHIISVEVSILAGFIIHSGITWRYRFKSNIHRLKKFLLFQGITSFSFALRQAIFYLLSLAGMDYVANTLIGIGVSIVFNFLGYDTIVFKKMKAGDKNAKNHR